MPRGCETDDRSTHTLDTMLPSIQPYIAVSESKMGPCVSRNAKERETLASGVCENNSMKVGTVTVE